MAHVIHRPWLVIVCWVADGGIVERWLEYREFRYDHEWRNYQIGYDPEVLALVGMYAAVVSPDTRLFEFARTSEYDPWFLIDGIYDEEADEMRP